MSFLRDWTFRSRATHSGHAGCFSAPRKPPLEKLALLFNEFEDALFDLRVATNRECVATLLFQCLVMSRAHRELRRRQLNDN